MSKIILKVSLKAVTVSLLLVLFLFTGCNSNSSSDSKQVPQMDFAELEPFLHKNNDTLYIVNFWATWCKPCVEEMPYFEKIGEEYKDEAVKIILVSLDFPDKLDELVMPFLQKKNIQSQVIHLTDMKAYQWIDKVSPEWSGAIPATIFYKGKGYRNFIEGSVTYEDLKEIVDNQL